MKSFNRLCMVIFGTGLTLGWLCVAALQVLAGGGR